MCVIYLFNEFITEYNNMYVAPDSGEYSSQRFIKEHLVKLHLESFQVFIIQSALCGEGSREGGGQPEEG
jgi:hypothetical protein